jgi:hypothetical protein
MRTPESRLERIEEIERKLARNPRGWTTGKLACVVHADPSTIVRDLSVLESLGTGLIKQGRCFFAILRHLRLDFPLITGQEVEGQVWWVLTQEQREEIY